jgi:hypothetical protein
MSLPPDHPFSSYNHITSSNLIHQNIIPSETYLAGTITVVWSELIAQTPSTSSSTPTPRIAFQLRCRIPITQSNPTTTDIQSAYILPPSSGTKSKICVFKINLRYNDGVEVDLERMGKDKDMVARINGKDVQVDCSGMKVVKVSRDEKGRTQIELEGRGERRIVKGDTTFKLLSGMFAFRPIRK